MGDTLMRDNQDASDAGTERRAHERRSGAPVVRRPCQPHHQAGRDRHCAVTLSGSTRCPRHEREYQAWRNRQVSRRRLYEGGWQTHSERRIAEVGRCMEEDGTCRGVLSADHPTDDVLCVSHHSRREARRRAVARGG